MSQDRKSGPEEEAAWWSAWAHDHPELRATLRELSLSDGEASRMLRFVVHHRELLSELELDNLADSAPRRLRLLRENEELLDGLEGMKSDFHQALGWLRFGREHPQIIDYLWRRRTLAQDIEDSLAAPRALPGMPRVELLWQLVRRRIFGLRS
jgi:hypothetical protein